MGTPASDADREPTAALLDALPDEVVAALQVRDRWRQQVADSGAGLEFVVSDLLSWRAGSTVRVAFLDGDPALHEKVADATRQITDACNLDLDFGRDESGGFRRWHTTDTTHVAEIRVSFDQKGYFSLLGTDSADSSIGRPGDLVGGGPGQRSLNLGGFTGALPQDWEGTVRHEFLHALAFSHEHQNLRGPCEGDFRWEDDPGYIPTQNPNGVFVRDPAGRRPGIYTYLAGPPNGWPRAKVDHNLRTADDPREVVGPFDPESVMLYSFADFFYNTTPSPCAPTGNGVDLSEGDKRGLRLLYPETGPATDEVATRAQNALDAIGGQESGLPGFPFADRVVELIREKAEG